jgi:hypothetical protein
MANNRQMIVYKRILLVVFSGRGLFTKPFAMRPSAAGSDGLVGQPRPVLLNSNQ